MGRLKYRARATRAAPAGIASAARHGFALECVRAEYGQTTQEAFDPSGRINTVRPDAVLLALDHRGLPLRFMAGNAQAEHADIDAAVSQLNAMRDAIRTHAGAVCIVQTLAPPPETLFGGLDRSANLRFSILG